MTRNKKLLFILFTTISKNSFSQKNEHFVWSQYSTTGHIEIRMIIDKNEECPNLSSRIRESITSTDRKESGIIPSISLCKYNALDSEKVIYTPDGKINLQRTQEDLESIIIIGDTGCRIPNLNFLIQHTLNSKSYQDCKVDWGFPSVASAAAKKEANLILHAGDIIYRDPCTNVNNSFCEKKKSDPEYIWNIWKGDFFEPAKDLLMKAPWIFTRGNHEPCSSPHGRVWFFLFGFEHNEKCSENEKIQVLKYNNVEIINLDSADIGDMSLNLERVKYDAQKLSDILSINDKDQPDILFLTHKPFWSIGGGKKMALSINQSLQYLSNLVDLSRVRLFVGGHLHLFQINEFVDKKGVQLVAGDGGAELHESFSEKLSNEEIKETIIGDRQLSNTYNDKGHGFTKIYFTDDAWTIDRFNEDGKLTTKCHLNKDRKVLCSYL